MSADRPSRLAFLSRLRERASMHPVRAVGYGAVLLIGIGLVGILGAVEVSSRPKFCGSCHIMKPYFESWRHSSHRNVECVECHIAPSVTAEIRKKYEALSMVVKYFTGTYGQNPWAEIEDAACLRCHERRLLIGTATLKDIQFDHSTHLQDMRRGKTLRCTSCHSQMVQGSHIAVTTSTCILCHFKGTTPGTGTARCEVCHKTPQKTVKIGTTTFNHADVSRFGMSCTSCHGTPQGSDGAVPRERCITCHNQAARLAKYTDTALLHRKHVSEHKVDCTYCHLQIQHVEPVQPETAALRMSLAAGQCRSCHETGHSPQLSLYTGTGGRGVPPMPSAMFQAGVRCEGCHFALPGHASVVDRASDVSCMSCHGASYRAIYLNWTEGSARRADALRRQMDLTIRAIGADSKPLADARHNLSLVERGRGVHNIRYAYALLRRASDDMNEGRRARGLPPMPRPWQEPAYSSPCLKCHEGIESRSGTIFGRDFAHVKHVIGAKLLCETCHRTHEEKRKGEVVRYDASGCESCHHSRPTLDCMSCHASVRQRKVKSPLGEFDHAMHLDDAGETCVNCHDLAAAPPKLKQDHCKECHE